MNTAVRLRLAVLFSGIFLSFFPLFSQWQPTGGPTGGVVYCLESWQGNWYAGTGSGIWKSADQGDTWSPADWVSPEYQVSSIEIRPGEILLGVVTPYFDDIVFDIEEVALILYRSTDNGQTWDTTTIGTEYYFGGDFSIFRVGSNLFAKKYNQILKSADDGQTWSPAMPGFFFPDFVSHSDDIITVGSVFGAIQYSADGGNSWQALSLPPDLVFSARCFAPGDSVLFCTDTYSPLYRSDDLGATWTDMGEPFYYTEIGDIRRVSGDRLAALVSYPDGDEMAYVSENNGQSWEKYNGSPSAVAFDIVAEGDQLGVASALGFYKNYNNGNFLNPSNKGLLTSNARDLEVTADGSALLAAARDGLYRSFDDGSTWFPAFPQNQLAGTVDLAVKGDTICALTIDNFYYSTDNGDAWMAPFSGGDPGPFQYEDAVTFAFDGDRLLVGAYDLYYSDNFGISWSKMSSALSYPRISGVFAESSAYFIMAFWDGIARSENQGFSWQVLEDGIAEGHFEYFNQRLFALSQRMLYSDDNGDTWQSPTGLPVLDDLVQSQLPVQALAATDSLLYAAVSLAGIFTSADNGTSWQPMAQQPPNRRFNDLLIHNGVLYAACTNGSVWKYNLTPVGATAPSLAQLLALWPNPVVENMTLATGIQSGVAAVRIFNVFGQCVFDGNFATDASGQVHCRIGELPPGAYTVCCITPEGTRTGKLIKKAD